MVLELSKVKVKKSGLIDFLKATEGILFERLSRLLFGSAEISEYEDLKLPSEDQEETDVPVMVERKTRRKRRRSIQLQLVLFRSARKLALKTIMGVEFLVKQISTSGRSKDFYVENTYRNM